MSAAGVHVARHGLIAKIVADVDQVTFSGRRAVEAGQHVLYVTERALFRLDGDGLVVTEIAPGVDLAPTSSTAWTSRPPCRPHRR